MLNKLGYTKVEVLAVVVLLGIVAFITINKTSYAFSIDQSSMVKEVKSLIENQAKEYAMDNLEIFKETSTTYINVNDLVEKGYLIGNEKGLITSPIDQNKSFNEDKIKLEYNKEEEKVTAILVD